MKFMKRSMSNCTKVEQLTCFVLTFVLLLSMSTHVTVFAAARATTNEDLQYDWFMLKEDGSAELTVKIAGGNSKLKTGAVADDVYKVMVTKDTSLSSIGYYSDTRNIITPASVMAVNEKEIKFTFSSGQLTAPAAVYVTIQPSAFVEANAPANWIGIDGLLMSDEGNGRAQQAILDGWNMKVNKIPAETYLDYDKITEIVLAKAAGIADKFTLGAGDKIRYQFHSCGTGAYSYNNTWIDPVVRWRGYISVGEEGFLLLETYFIIGNASDGAGAPDLDVVVLNNDNYNGKTIKDYMRFTSGATTQLSAGDKILIFEGNNASAYPVNGAKPVATAVVKDAEIVKGVKETKMPHAIASFPFTDGKYYFYAVAKDSKDIIGKTTQIDEFYFKLQEAEFERIETYYVKGVGKVNDSIVVSGLKPGDMVYISPNTTGTGFSKEDEESWKSMLDEINADLNLKKTADAVVKKGSTSAVYYFKTKPAEGTRFNIGVRQAQRTSVRLDGDGAVESFIDRAVSKIELVDILKVANPAAIDELDYFISYNPTEKNSLIVLTGLSPGTYVALYDEPDNSKPVKTLTVKKGRNYAVFESVTLASNESSFWVYICTADSVTKATDTTVRFEFNKYDEDDVIDGDDGN